MTEKIKVLFVCLGNICRSPTAEGVFTKLVNDAGLDNMFKIDSAGTAAYHIGKQPDLRSITHAEKRGYELAHLKARKVDFTDFYEFDHILAMDKSNFDDLIHLAPNDMKHKVKMMLSYGTKSVKEVPDPYYEKADGFEIVLDLLEDACRGFLKSVNG
jgi:protein-tyrosine phosphatase